VRTEFFTPDVSIEREGFLLVVAALEPYKRTDLVISAAIEGGLPLKVVGSGTQFDALQSRTKCAGARNIELLGRVNDDELRDLYRRAKALVFPQVEDFGIIPVEAMACGCPVIAFNRGGALDTVTAETGVLFDEQSTAAIREAAAELERRPRDPAACRSQAERFSEAAFDRAMIEAASSLLNVE
jgi:glycosyltransferase involved in cell wall biosynthesis